MCLLRLWIISFRQNQLMFFRHSWHTFPVAAFIFLERCWRMYNCCKTYACFCSFWGVRLSDRCSPHIIHPWIAQLLLSLSCLIPCRRFGLLYPVAVITRSCRALQGVVPYPSPKLRSLWAPYQLAQHWWDICLSLWIVYHHLCCWAWLIFFESRHEPVHHEVVARSFCNNFTSMLLRHAPPSRRVHGADFLMLGVDFCCLW